MMRLSFLVLAKAERVLLWGIPPRPERASGRVDEELLLRIERDFGAVGAWFSVRQMLL